MEQPAPAEPAKLPAQAAVIPAPSPLQWVEDETIPGRAKVVEHSPGGPMTYAGSHLLATMVDGVSTAEVEHWLQANGAGRLLENRHGLLKIAPLESGLEPLLQLRREMEAARGRLFMHVEPDYLYHRMIQTDDPVLELPGAWYFEAVGAFEGWKFRREAGNIVVAVVDSGIPLDSPEFDGNYWRNPADGTVGYDFINNDPYPEDTEGHGTAVAGLIGARADNGLGSAGIAWKVQLMSLKVVDEYGYIENSNVIAAINLAVEMGAHIINLSLGTDGESALLEAAVKRAGNAQVALVCAAGNAGSDLEVTPLYPASFDYPHVLQVGSSTVNGNRAPFSNYNGQLVDFFAPGAGIEVLDFASIATSGTRTGNGTSFSAPIVSGILALVMEAFPGDSLMQQIQRLRDAAVFHEQLAGYSQQGTVVNLARALSGYRPQPPVIRWTENPVKRDFGKSLTLQPEISADSSFEIEWRRDGQLLAGRTMPFISMDPFSPEDAGTYTVKATSMEGSTVSEPLTLEGTPVGPVIHNISPSLTVLSGTEVLLWIDASGTRPVVVDWYREGDPQPILEDSRRLHVVVEETTRFYARVRHRYGETVADYITVTVDRFDWLDQLQSSVVDYHPPLGSILKTHLALEPVYWSIPLSGDLLHPREFPSGVYYNPSTDSSRLARIAPDGSLHVSEPIAEGYVLFDVVDGYAILRDSQMNGMVLDPQMRVVAGALDGKKPLAVDAFNGWFHELFLDPRHGRPGFRKSRDFVNYTVLMEEIPEPWQPMEAYDYYSLRVGDGVASLFIPAPHTWTPAGGIVEASYHSFVVEHEGSLYRKATHSPMPAVIEVFDTDTAQWRFYDDATESALLRLGFSGFRESLGMRQVFDGETWVSVWSNSNTTGRRSWPIEAATSKAFFRTLEGTLWRSEDGYRWRKVNYPVPMNALMTAVADTLVIIEGTEAAWIDDESIVHRPMHFAGEQVVTEWTALRTINGLHFLLDDLGGNLWVSEDLQSWRRSSLSNFPYAVKREADGSYRALFSSGQWFASDDAVDWAFHSTAGDAPNQPWNYFSLGIFAGNRYSPDGEVWVDVPFSAHRVLETENRVFFLGGEGMIGANGTYYLDRTNALPKPSPALTPVPYIRRTSERIPHEPIAVELDLSSVLPAVFESAQIHVPGFPVMEVEEFPFNFEIVVDHSSRVPVHYTVDFGGDAVITGSLQLNVPMPIQLDPLASGTDSGKSSAPQPWKDGWIAVISGRIQFSRDLYSWSEVAGVARIGTPLRRILVFNDQWLLIAGYSETQAGLPYSVFLSADEGKTWQELDSSRIPGQLVAVLDGGILLARKYQRWYLSRDPVNWPEMEGHFFDTDRISALEGMVYYISGENQLVAVDSQTGASTVVDTDVVGIGAAHYLRRHAGPSPSVTVHGIHDQVAVAALPWVGLQWDGHAILTSFKDGHFQLNLETTVFSGHVDEPALRQHSLNYSLKGKIVPETAHIGPYGVKLTGLGGISRLPDDPLRVAMEVEIANASPVALSAAEGLMLQLQWHDPLRGHVLNESLHPLNLDIPFAGKATVPLELQLPKLDLDRELSLRFTLLPQLDSGVRGISVAELEGVLVKVESALSAGAVGVGRLFFSAPGPYRIGTTVEVTAEAGPGHTFAHWQQPRISPGRKLSMRVEETTNVNAVFLPHPIAAISRWAVPADHGQGNWFVSHAKNLYLHDANWAFSDAAGWLTAFQTDGGLLASWSPQHGWLISHGDWLPYHWSCSSSQWIRLEP